MKIPATVITGFLGAGKTTPIRHLPEHADFEGLVLLLASAAAGRTSPGRPAR